MAVLALGPVGCGFRPLYGTPSGSAAGMEGEMAGVRIGPIKDRAGQQLRNALVQRLSPRGEAADYAYALDVRLSENVSSLGFRRDTFATVANMTITAQVRLVGERAVLMGESVTTTVYFDFLGPRYASLATERDAEERALNQLADEIRNRVAVAIQQYQANPNDERYRRKGLFQDGRDGAIR